MSEQQQRTVVADVVRLGDKIVVPEGASLKEVGKLLLEKHEEEQQLVKVHATVNVPPWDGARALHKAIEQELGLTIQVAQRGFFEPVATAGEIEVEVALGKTEKIRWGKFKLPGMGDDAFAETSVQMQDGSMVFYCSVVCKRMHHARATRLLDSMRRIATTESLHKGKAFAMRFLDDDGNVKPLPEPKFFDYNVEQPMFNDDLEQAIDRNIFTPIRLSSELRKMGEPLKRGVLFAGEYGTGKTMLATYIARVAEENGWTFMYVKDSRELPMALKYAQRYQPVVVFAEDVDRVAGEQRTNAVNDLLNQLDGIDSKTAGIMTILTSNHADKINIAMRRPGRIDLLLEVKAPDAKTVQRMIHHFARGGLEPDTSLDTASSILAGTSAAIVRETIGRARLEALRRTGSAKGLINGQDLANVAAEVMAERERFGDKKTAVSTAPIEQLGSAFIAAGAELRGIIAAGAKDQSTQELRVQ